MASPPPISSSRDDEPSAGWALILGVSSGFGAATARRLAAAGLDVAGLHLDRRAARPRLERLGADIEAEGRRLVTFNRNAADEAAPAEVLTSLQAETGFADRPLRLLLHSLAFGSMGHLATPPDDDSRPLSLRQLVMTQEVMAHSLVLWTRATLERGMLGRGSRVLALTSLGAERVVPAYGAVAAAKAALEAHVRGLAVELAPLGITANALRPGVTDTAALRQIPGAEQILEGAAARNPSGRLTEPDDVARLTLALLAPAFDWVTGNVIGVDGGESLVV